MILHYYYPADLDLTPEMCRVPQMSSPRGWYRTIQQFSNSLMYSLRIACPIPLLADFCTDRSSLSPPTRLWLECNYHFSLGLGRIKKFENSWRNLFLNVKFMKIIFRSVPPDLVIFRWPHPNTIRRIPRSDCPTRINHSLNVPADHDIFHYTGYPSRSRLRGTIDRCRFIHLRPPLSCPPQPDPESRVHCPGHRSGMGNLRPGRVHSHGWGQGSWLSESRSSLRI